MRTCPKCGSDLVFIHGNYCDYDTWNCFERGCGYFEELDQTTMYEEICYINNIKVIYSINYKGDFCMEVPEINKIFIGRDKQECKEHYELFCRNKMG